MCEYLLVGYMDKTKKTYKLGHVFLGPFGGAPPGSGSDIIETLTVAEPGEA